MAKLISILLRGGGVLGKFLLTIIITKNISLEFQGAYSIMITNVALLIMFLGWDLYIYTNRQIVKDNNSLVFVFKNSLVFYACSYVALIPISLVLVYYNLVQKELLLIFFCLVVLEHLSQELFRIYIALEKVVFANILFFLRSGLWSWALVLYFYLGNGTMDSLFGILLVWSISSLIAVILGIVYLPNIKTFFDTPLKAKWIVKGIKVGSFMFIATILLKFIEYSDRYLIDFFLGKKELGVYSFYFQIANIINVIIFTLYISFLYPRIMNSVYQKDIFALNKCKKEIYKSTFTIVGLVLLTILFFLPYTLDIMGRPELNENKEVLYLLVLSTLFFNFSFGSHFVLIAEEREKLIIKTTLITFVVNIVLNLVLIPHLGILGASISLVISSLTLWATKFFEEVRLVKRW